MTILRHITKNEINAMSSRYRAQMINSLSGFKSANLIGTCDQQGAVNLAIFSSVVHLGSSPALMGFIMRPDSVDRHTLDNIIATKQYTINQVSESFWMSAHQTSARYPRNESEFEHTGLSTSYIDNFKAPFVKQSHVKYALTLDDIVAIPSNNTQLIIGKITDVLCRDTAIKKDGYIDIETEDTVSITGLDSYHTSTRLSRLSYAKPDHFPKSIPLDGVTSN